MFFNPSISCSSASLCLATERAPGGLHLGRLHVKEDGNESKNVQRRAVRRVPASV